MEWTDRVPRRLLMSWPWAFLDLITVVAPGLNDWDVRYSARRSEGTLTVEGTSDSFRSRAVLSLSGSAHTLTVTRGTLERVITLTPHDQHQEVSS